MHTRRYDAWGRRVEGAAAAAGEPRVGYTGHEADAESELVYAQARYYEPETGTFLGPDPFDGVLTEPGSLSRFVYVEGNPLLYRDPDGRRSVHTYGHPMKQELEEMATNHPLAGAAGVGQRLRDAFDPCGQRPQTDAPQSGWARDAFCNASTTLGKLGAAPLLLLESTANELMRQGDGLGDSLGKATNAAREGEWRKAGGHLVDAAGHVAMAGLTALSVVPAVGATAGLASRVSYGAASLGRRAAGYGARVAGRGGARRAGGSLAGQALAANWRAGGPRAGSMPDVPGSPVAPLGQGRCVGQHCDFGLCFVAGTPVATPDGLRPIESIEAGDLVLSRDAETGEVAFKAVAQTFVRQAPGVLTVEAVDASGAQTSLGTTPEHPFWVVDQGWVAAGELVPGDELYTSSGGWLRVTGSTWAAEGAVVYNFEVEGFHTYFVGEAGVWVHNADYGGAPEGAGRGYVSGFREIRATANEAKKRGGYAGEIQAAKWLREQGRNVHFQSPGPQRSSAGGTADFVVDGARGTGRGGNIYDVFTPETTSARRNISSVAGKHTQTRRVILNLIDSDVDMSKLGDVLRRANGMIRSWGHEGSELIEVLILR